MFDDMDETIYKTVEEAVTDVAPAEETPVNEAPVNETPVQETPQEPVFTAIFMPSLFKSSTDWMPESL